MGGPTRMLIFLFSWKREKVLIVIKTFFLNGLEIRNHDIILNKKNPAFNNNGIWRKS